jgi:3'(2'), 5'-bisphosphate nucleotidase
MIDDLVSIVRRAGERILEFYDDPGRITEKENRTPLTEADHAAHRLLAGELRALAPGIPVLSEESPEHEIAERRSWRRFWLVDPLDGTKEFLKRTGEFTVNVALVEDGRPTVGVVHVPVSGRTYRASAELGAQVGEGAADFRPIRTRSFAAGAPVLVASRDHAGPGVEALQKALGEGVELTNMGSSLKFCLVAEGRADLYLRDRPTMEWDTGAAQCIVEAAGGGVFGLDEAPLVYNKTSLLNPSFLAVGDPSGPWRDLVRRIAP